MGYISNLSTLVVTYLRIKTRLSFSVAGRCTHVALVFAKSS